MKNLLCFLLLLTSSFVYAFPNAQQMNSKINQVPKDLQESVFNSPKENLPALVKNLTSSASDAGTKVRIIHDWICQNISYDIDMYFSSRVTKQDYESVLKKKKAVCSGYSSVFVEMCRIAGIEAIRIQGYSKGFGYSGDLNHKPDHEWNAVKIGSSYKLVDCCWDAGYVEGKTFVKKYSTEWYFLAPEKMLYSHLPENEEHQFVKPEKIKTKEQFVKEPFITGKFFSYGFELTDNIPDYNTFINGETVFTFKLTKSGVETSSNIFAAGSYQGEKKAVWIDRVGSAYYYNFDVPDTQKYRACIFAKNKGSSNYNDKFSEADFEGRILPQAQSLVSASPVSGKTISKADFDIFKDAFFKSKENHCYYYKENLFNTKRINVVKNVFKILKESDGYLEPVLNFNLQASDGYSGFGEVVKFPTVYTGYNSTVNTKLVSPVQGVLKEKQTYIFEFESKDYTGMALTFGKDLVPFVKNVTNFKYEGEVPEGTIQVTIYGTKNNKNYEGLLFYTVEK